MPLPNADQFIGQNVTESGFKEAQTQLIQFLGDEVPTNEQLVNIFATMELADSKTELMPIDYKVTVSNDPDETKNGDYTWNGTELVKSPYDPVTISNGYTNSKVDAVSAAITLKKANDPTIFNIVNDSLGNSLVWIDKATGIFNAVGLLQNIFTRIFQLKSYSNTDVIAGEVDSDGNALWGIKKSTGKFFAAGLEPSSVQQKTYKYFAQKPIATEINHMLSYGESLSVGATAQNILSTSQPYLNTTFSKGPRLDPLGSGETLGIIPLVEQYNSPASDGGGNRGETHCSGAANYASLELIRKGISPNEHIIFASTAGYGGAKISDLAKGGAIYPRVLNHINKARELNAGKSHKAVFTPFIIGTNDAFYATSYVNFKNTFQQVHLDFNADVKALTGQDEDVLFAIVQISYGVKTQPQISKALWDLPQENENFLFITPTYHLQHSEGTHLTNIGYKRLGAYFGRAYSQYYTEGRYPDCIKPLAALVEGSKIQIKFDVPALPLQVDRTTLAQTTDDGFKVLLLDENGLIATDTNGDEIALPILKVSAEDDSVFLELNAPPTNQILVRYAMDYLGAGLNILNGASGNLRDSTPDSVDIAGVTQHLYHVCPHFELVANLDKGI
jgi:hypothetical protein